jgi:hypothetical protein
MSTAEDAANMQLPEVDYEEAKRIRHAIQYAKREQAAKRAQAYITKKTKGQVASVGLVEDDEEEEYEEEKEGHHHGNKKKEEVMIWSAAFNDLKSKVRRIVLLLLSFLIGCVVGAVTGKDVLFGGNGFDL